jgi:hypothetical protein
MGTDSMHQDAMDTAPIDTTAKQPIIARIGAEKVATDTLGRGDKSAEKNSDERKLAENLATEKVLLEKVSIEQLNTETLTTEAIAKAREDAGETTISTGTMSTVVSLRAEVPQSLHGAMAAFIETHPHWDQYRLFQAALAGFLVQNGSRNRAISRCYLANLFPGSRDFFDPAA